MDHKVDAKYKDKYFPRPPPAAASASAPAASTSKGKQAAPPPTPPTGVNTAHHSSATPEAVGSLIASFAGLRIQPTTKAKLESNSDTVDAKAKTKDNTDEQEVTAEPGFSPLATIPSEILLQILRALALTDVASYARLAQVCKALCFIVNTEESIWHDVCSSIYSQQLWDWKCAVDGSELIKIWGETLDGEKVPEENPDEDTETEKRTIPVDDEEVLKYNNSWKKMLRLRSRVRFNGVYISTCNYLRKSTLIQNTKNMS
jgi:F-box protein 9